MTEETCQAMVSGDSIKVIGESIGISSLSDEVAKELAEDVTYKLKIILQDALKFTLHGKRKKFLTQDFDEALKQKGMEPVYGVASSENIPWRQTSGGGRDLHFLEDREVDLAELIGQPMPKLPAQPSIRAHWLAIDGLQPAIPENPAPFSRETQKQDAVDPAAKLSGDADPQNSRTIHGRGLKSVETVRVKQLATHELSAEQQLYYKEITEACVGSDEPKRGEALHSLSFDPGLHQMVARLCTFISEGVRINVVQKNLALLIYLMRMTKALLDNASLYLEKYLHELTPSVLTCIVSRQLCLKPDMDNHWALRDFAARLNSQMCRHYNTTTNAMQTRVTRIFSRCLNNEQPMSTVYGAVAGLCELGPEVTKALILPRIAFLSAKVEQCLEGATAYEKNAGNHIKGMLVKTVPAVLKSYRSPPDVMQEYIDDFGLLGPALHCSVMKLRIGCSSPAPAPLMTMPMVSSATTAVIQPTISSGTRILNPVMGTRTVMVRGPPPPPANSAQKLIVMPARQSMSGSPDVIMSSTGEIIGQPKLMLIKPEPVDDSYNLLH